MQNIRKIIEPNDILPRKELARNDDILIPVMGPTGVGKSTFINNIFQKTNSPHHAESSDGFKSCTTSLTDYRVEIPADVVQRYPFTKGRHLVLVDTPGFDNIAVSDTEILRRLAVWLASAYDAEMKVGGVVYMYPVYPGRMTRNDCANIKVFQKICGHGGLSRVILATTRWNTCSLPLGESREKEIWNAFWNDSPDAPPQSTSMARLNDTPESAWAIIETILSKTENNGVVLALQKQLVDKGKSLPQTDAAQELRAKILSLLHESTANHSAVRKERLEMLEKEAKELKIPLSKRIQGLFGIYG